MKNKSYAPNHIMEYCYRDKNDSLYLSLCGKYEDINSFVYKLKCKCDCKKFILYKDKHPSVFAKCSNCEEWITIYDLKYYPSAVKIKKEMPLEHINLEAAFVYVNYEYDDEFLYEEDVDFNIDDITWGRAFMLNDNELVKILDDETA